MHWTFRDCETDASELRAMATVAENDVVPASAIGRGIGLSFTVRAARGCVAQIDVASGSIYLHAHGHAWTQNFNTAHELSHLQVELTDSEWPHDEDRVDMIAVALLMPREVVLDVLLRIALDDPAALIAAFPAVPPSWVLLRCAWVLGRPVAVHINGRRVWMPEHHVGATVVSLWEQRLVRDVRQTMQRQRAMGGEGIPVGERGADGVLVIFSASNEEW